MERTLAAFARSDAPLAARLAVVRELARTVADLHARGRTQCTLRPDSVLVLSSGAVLLARPGAARGPLAAAGYDAPEVARGGRGSRRADAFSLGALAYLVLAGNGPFDAEEPLESVRKVLFEEPEPLRRVVHEVPLEVESAIAELLEKRRGRRGTAGALVRAVSAATAPSKAPSPQPSPPAAAGGEGELVRRATSTPTSTPTSTSTSTSIPTPTSTPTSTSTSTSPSTSTSTSPSTPTPTPTPTPTSTSTSTATATRTATATSITRAVRLERIADADASARSRRAESLLTRAAAAGAALLTRAAADGSALLRRSAARIAGVPAISSLSPLRRAGLAALPVLALALVLLPAGAETPLEHEIAGLVEQGDLEGARARLELAGKERPGDPLIGKLRGDVACARGAPGECVRRYRVALAARPDFRDDPVLRRNARRLLAREQPCATRRSAAHLLGELRDPEALPVLEEARRSGGFFSFLCTGDSIDRAITATRAEVRRGR